jgi:hypothetical protein
MQSLEKIFKDLGLNSENGLYKKMEKLPDYPSRIKIPLESINYDAIFDLDKKPMIIFKSFDLYFKNAKKEIYSFHKQIWNLNETPVLFIILKDEIQIYNGFIFNKTENTPINRIIQINEAKKIFSYETLISGSYWRENEKIFSKDTRVQDYLIKNLRLARDTLAKNTPDRRALDFKIINNLLGRLIFSRYLIDRGYFDEKFFNDNYKVGFIKLISNKEKLYKYFKYLQKEFNGDMFPLKPEEELKVTGNHLRILSRLFDGQDLSTGQNVLFDVYDFSIIPIELISNIYEVFLNEESRRNSKVYYTPSFLVDHILNQTLSKKIDETNSANIKVLDPACGSGIFLVESLRRLIKKQMENKNRHLSNNELKDVIKNNIFGIDVDENAICISIFSIYLTLLDYQENVNIENFKFPELINKNIFKADFFDIEHKFNKIFASFNGLDIIVGNPPWSKKGGIYEDYCIKNQIPLAEKQITQAFLVRSRDFVNKDADLALIVNSRLLYNFKGEDYKNFRKYFLENFIIKMVFELAPLRKKLFEKAVGPGVILFYKIKIEDIENDIEYISLKPNKLYTLFRSLTLEKYDRKFIPQKCFLKYDWLWKVALYGGINDFLLLKKLKSNKNTLKNFIEENENLYSGVGVFVGNGGKYSSNEFKETFFIDIKKYRDQIFKRYFINTNIDSKWPYDKVKRIDPSLYSPPYVIIKNSPDKKHFEMKSAFSNQKMIFKKGIMAIGGDNNQVKVLWNFLGLINSKLFTYYQLSTSSALGVERDVLSKDEILSFPFIEDDLISEKAENLQKLYGDLFKSNEFNFELNDKIKILDKDLNDHIFDLYGLNTIERDLVDYVKIPISLYNWQSYPFENPEDEELKEYAEVFISFFRHRLEDKKHFCVEIYQTDYFIAMNFNITSNKPKNLIKFLKNENMDIVLDKIGNLSFEEISKNLYAIKDIKGFEKSSFYIIRPKERKNWHRSIARTDLNEFINAIIMRDHDKIEAHGE